MKQNKRMTNETINNMDENGKKVSYTVLILGLFFATSQNFTDDLFFPTVQASDKNENLCQQNNGTINNSFFPLENYRDYCQGLDSSTCEQINGTWKSCLTEQYTGQPSYSGVCVLSNTCILFDQEVYQKEIDQENQILILTVIITLGLLIALSVFVLKKIRSRGDIIK